VPSNSRRRIWIPPASISVVLIATSAILQFRRLGDLYAYEGGLGWRFGGIYTTLLSIVALVLFARVTSRIKDIEVNLVSIVFLILIVIPAVAITPHSFSLEPLVVAKNCALIVGGTILFLSSFYATSQLIKSRSRKVHISDLAINANGASIIKVLAVLSILSSVYVYGIPTSLPAIFSVYDLRLSARVAAAQSPILAYLSSWLVTVIVPLLVVIWVENRDKVALALAGLSSIVVFASIGAKTALFTALVLIGAGRVDLDKGFKRPARIIAGALAGLSMTGFLPVVGTFFSVVVVRRIFLIPAQIQGRFVEFFSSHSPAGFGESGIGSLVFAGPYGRTAAEVVGSRYFNAETSANANFITDSFGSFGYLGAIVGCCVAGLLLGVVSSLLPARSPAGRIILLFASVSILSSASLLTSLLTHGLLLIPLIGLVQISLPQRPG
jgi:hypothetical protein